MLDFDAYKVQIKRFLLNGIKQFVDLKNDIIVSCVALYSHPINGWLFLNFDSVRSDESFVDNWSSQGKNWVGKDDNGMFNNNCPDFDFFEFVRIDFQEWIDEIEHSPIITIKHPIKNKKINLETDGDELLNKEFLSFFIGIMKELEQEHAFKELKKSESFRLGVQLLDSDYERFWKCT